MSGEEFKYEKIRMTPAIASAWYGSSLVGAVSGQDIQPAPISSDPASGAGSQQTISGAMQEILVFYRSMPEQVKESGMQFLSNVLKACKLSLREVALFEGPGPGDLETLRTTCTPRAMLMFGIDPPATGLPLRVPHFQVMDHGGIKILAAPPLEELIEDKQRKTALWAALQKIFTA